MKLPPYNTVTVCELLMVSAWETAHTVACQATSILIDVEVTIIIVSPSNEYHYIMSLQGNYIHL